MKKKRLGLTGPQTMFYMASIHKEKYSFWFGSFLTDAAFTSQAINNNIEFTIKLVSGDYKLKKTSA